MYCTILGKCIGECRSGRPAGRLALPKVGHARRVPSRGCPRLPLARSARPRDAWRTCTRGSPPARPRLPGATPTATAPDAPRPQETCVPHLMNHRAPSALTRAMCAFRSSSTTAMMRMAIALMLGLAHGATIPPDQEHDAIQPPNMEWLHASGSGCDWTSKWTCPPGTANHHGHPGPKGYAGDDGSPGFKCCCEAMCGHEHGHEHGPEVSPGVSPSAPHPMPHAW